MKNLEERQREMHQRAEREGITCVETTLERIKSAQLTTDDEFMEVMRLIKLLEGRLEPASIFMLQLEAIVEHYNTSRSPQDVEKTTADALLLALRGRGEKQR
ncbi:MAG: hypothetical protein WBS19_03755 [Candidatus Korobacteraceae bacterium]